MADPSLLSAYDLPADIPGYDLDPKELERLKYMGLMRFGLGLAGREPIGSAMTAGFNTTMEGQVNARREMLARLQAYAEAQKIAAKRQELAQQAAIQKELGGVPGIGQPDLTTMGTGGPTPANAAALEPMTRYQQLLRYGDILAKRGLTEDAKRYFDAAKDIQTKYSETLTPVRLPNGQLGYAQASATVQPRIAAGITPAEKMSVHDVGGNVQQFGEYGTQGAVIPKTMTYADRNAAAQLALARAREGREAGPHWDSGLQQWVSRPSTEFPTGRAVTPTGVDPNKPLTESQSKATAFATMQSQATNVINDLGTKGFTGKGKTQQLDLGRAGTEGIPYVPGTAAIPRWTSSDQAQQYEQAASVWSESNLRFLTGANAPEAEVQRNRNLFFPSPGDSDAKIEQKAQMRQYAEKAIRYAAGHGVKHLPPLAEVPVAPDVKAAVEAAAAIARANALLDQQNKNRAR